MAGKRMMMDHEETTAGEARAHSKRFLEKAAAKSRRKGRGKKGKGRARRGRKAGRRSKGSRKSSSRY